MFIRVADSFSIYLIDVWESVDDESSQENSIGNLITFYG